MKTLTKALIMAVLVYAPFALSSRFPASIQELNKDYTKRQMASLLQKHYTAVDTLRNDLIHKHLNYFKKTHQPSNADFNALEEDLKYFLKVDALVTSTGVREEAKITAIPDVMNALSDSQKKQAEGLIKDFNSNIFPHLYRAVITKNKKSVVSHLRKWSANNKKYSQLIKAGLKAAMSLK